MIILVAIALSLVPVFTRASRADGVDRFEWYLTIAHGVMVGYGIGILYPKKEDK